MEYYSHIGQDKWVAETFRRARGGYFLDFGAFDGITTSNTIVLEKELGWTGICVEPNALLRRCLPSSQLHHRQLRSVDDEPRVTRIP